jgi:hypothetical protein
LRPKYNKAEGEKERNESQRIASHQSSIGSDMFPSEDLSHKEQQDQQPNHGLAKNLFRRHRAPPLRHINEARDLEPIFHLILSFTIVDTRVKIGRIKEAVRRKLPTHFQSMNREKE